MAEKERFYAAPRLEVFDAVLGVIEGQRKWRVRAEDRADGYIGFKTGGSIWTTYGQDMTAWIVDGGDGWTRLSVQGGIAGQDTSQFHMEGYQLWDWGEKGRVTRRLFKGVNASLGVETRESRAE
jgi:hypothetical protein